MNKLVDLSSHTMFLDKLLKENILVQILLDSNQKPLDLLLMNILPQLQEKVETSLIHLQLKPIKDNQ